MCELTEMPSIEPNINPTEGAAIATFVHDGQSVCQASKLCHMAHVMIENRQCLVVDTRTTLATGTAEREAALAMIGAIPGQHRITVGADKAYDTADFVADMRDLRATAHVTQNDKGRRSAIDGRTTRHAGYQVSLRVRKRIEEAFGWMKVVGGQRKTRYRGTALVGWMFSKRCSGALL